MADDEAPQDGDYIVFDTGPLGSLTGVSVIGGRHAGTFYAEGDAYRHIAERMERERYWPNVWRQDDHGGMALASTEGAFAERGV